jgi:ankyrin repeat protein
LHFAAENKNREIFDLLVKFNGNVGIQDKSGNFPMIRISLHQSIKFDEEYREGCVCESCKLF